MSGRVLRVATVCVVACVLSCVCAASSFALGGRLMAWWGVTVGARPSVLVSGETGQVVLSVENRGDGAADGTKSPIVVRDVLPEGVKVVSMEGLVASGKAATASRFGCSESVALAQRTVTCTFAGVVHPFEGLEVRIGVQPPGGVSSVQSTASVTGGGAPEAVSATQSLPVGGENRFGVNEFQLVPEESGGRVDTQAGSHPFQLTSVVTLNQDGELPDGEVYPVALPKEVDAGTPVGLFGNPTPFEQCTDNQFTTIVNEQPACPDGSVIGVANITFSGGGVGFYTAIAPIFNMTPLKGEPARFGFYTTVFPVTLDVSVGTGGDYHVTVSSHNITQIAGLLSAKLTFWGVPGDPRHDGQRGTICVERPGTCKETEEESGSAPPPFLSLPTSCDGPWQESVSVASWLEPQHLLTSGPSGVRPSMDGCEALPFSPSVSVSPDQPYASTATGLTVKVSLPQTAALNPQGLAEGTVRDTTLVLPAGVTLNPGGGSGLGSCSETEIGYQGQAQDEPALSLFTATLPLPGEAFCPDASKVALARISTPLLANPLKGAVYLADPAPQGEAGRNPFGSLLTMYIVAEDPVSGTLVKLPGRVLPCETAGQKLAGTTCQAQGQLVSIFEDTPQLPFEDLTLHFFGEGRAPLATPAFCGSYTTSAALVPWSAAPGEQAHTATSSFQITAGPGGGACPSDPRPFTPGFYTGTTNNQAGGFSELRTTMGHPDEDQPLSALSITMAPGLMGSLTGVKLCGEPQAAQGTCGPESLIGHTTVTAGLGATPAVVARPGSVFITGPYNGHGSCTVGETGCAPFGLSIANPAEVGPFDLQKGTACDCIVVRAKVNIDPRTAQLSIESGSLPTTLKGIPLDLQHIAVQIDRAHFTFNPTNCETMRITGTMSGSEGANVPVSERFQAANCANLKFAPKFNVTTSGHTSRANGASLDVKLNFPKAPFGTQANIHAVKVDLPKQLPSELKTLQHACPHETFEADPSACSAASRVGTVKAITPVLPVPLEGPAYFVSYAGLKFPELIFVLQGYGVTVLVHAETFISKAGITSSTLRSVPDVPVESFELKLPQGPFSALGANSDLCKAGKLVIVKKRVRRKVKGRYVHVTIKVKRRKPKLVMPTAFTGQNGATIHTNTPIAVTGCAKPHKKAKKASRHAHHGRKKG